MKIYTYYEDIEFRSQLELISLWKESWERNGFQAIVLNQSHARQHVYYKEFDIKINEVVELVTGKPLSKYGKSCYMRWLAYASQPNEKFFVGDYDVINNALAPFQPEDRLCFYDRFCPCLASGTPEQFYNLCRSFIDVTLSREEQIKTIFKQLNLRSYHDQDFFVCSFCPARNPDVKKTCGYLDFDFKPRGIVTIPKKDSEYLDSDRAVHFSHNSTSSVFGAKHAEVNEKRIKAIKDMRHVKYIEKKWHPILSDCIQDFSPVGGGVRENNNSLNELGKELTLLGIKSLLPSINTFSNLINLELPKIERYDESKNTETSEKLKELFNRHGSDKSIRHDYHLALAEVFSKLDVLGNLNILEIGLGSQNPSIASRMSGKFTAGSSIRAYKEYFPNSKIFGADIDEDILFTEDRIKTSYVDQLNPSTFEKMHENFNFPSYDLFIEDGLHSFAASLNTLNFALKYTKKGGIIVLEDLGNQGNLWNMVTALLLSKGYNVKLIDCNGLMLVIYL